MRVFVGMECSQTIQRAFEVRGHDAWSCDLKPGLLNPSRHIQGDVHKVLRELSWTPDLIILHPVCTFLSSSGQHWTDKPGQRSSDDREQAILDFMACTGYGPRLCIENPMGIMSTRWKWPSQRIQPYWFGEDASKRTCLWLENLPLLRPTAYVAPRMIDGKPRWANQTDTGQNRVGPAGGAEVRRTKRSTTYPGIANAMADQWGVL
jgi:hypothetical protein